MFLRGFIVLIQLSSFYSLNLTKCPPPASASVVQLHNGLGQVKDAYYFGAATYGKSPFNIEDCANITVMTGSFAVIHRNNREDTYSSGCSKIFCLNMYKNDESILITMCENVNGKIILKIALGVEQNVANETDTKIVLNSWLDELKLKESGLQVGDFQFIKGPCHGNGTSLIIQIFGFIILTIVIVIIVIHIFSFCNISANKVGIVG